METSLGSADLGLWPQLKAVERGFFERSQDPAQDSAQDSARDFAQSQDQDWTQDWTQDGTQDRIQDRTQNGTQDRIREPAEDSEATRNRSRSEAFPSAGRPGVREWSEEAEASVAPASEESTLGR